ncbi:hypothetical protein BOTBODRAFT_293846 [Botryobasidium botryosum FD-172 SS1]|uniref:Uncharacterized protein n=1 Tax=Botryobasidium botryosum (strain FD-172 SS1) TaxID=930990 RepID=A0A067MUG6_BOTB1|nr:hypothetical protein BOTBODRAFT_293846 [Botryobasidium botryosum FD-172 SS1]
MASLFLEKMKQFRTRVNSILRRHSTFSHSSAPQTHSSPQSSSVDKYSPPSTSSSNPAPVSLPYCPPNASANGDPSYSTQHTIAPLTQEINDSIQGFQRVGFTPTTAHFRSASDSYLPQRSPPLSRIISSKGSIHGRERHSIHVANRHTVGYVPEDFEDQSPLTERDERNESPQSNLEELPNPFRVPSSRLETNDVREDENSQSRSSHYDEDSESVSYPSIVHAPAESPYSGRPQDSHDSLRPPDTPSWRTYQLPDGASYWTKSQLHLVSDIAPNELELPPEEDLPPGTERWIRSLHNHSSLGEICYVDHATRKMLSSGQAREDSWTLEEKLASELQYWRFIEKHPAHAPLLPSATDEVLEMLAWSYAEHLLITSQDHLPPFEKDESRELSALIRCLDLEAPNTLLKNSIIAKLHIRITLWRQVRHDPSTMQSWHNAVISLLHMAIPGLYDHANTTKKDIKHLSTPSFRASLGILAALLLDVSVSCLNLPQIKSTAKIAAEIAAICAAASILASILSLRHHGRVDCEPYSSRHILQSLPFAFLLWAILSLLFGLIFYASRTQPLRLGVMAI